MKMNDDMGSRVLASSRRSLLSTAAALGVGAPLFTGLLGRAPAAAAASKPYRFVLIRAGNGFGRSSGALAPHRMVPAKARNAQGVPLPLAALPAAVMGPAREVMFTSADDLPPSLAPLRRWWQSTMVMDRFYNPHGVGLHGNGGYTYTVMPPPGPGMPWPVPIDTAMARSFGDALAFPVVRMDYKGDTAANYFDRYLGAVGPGGLSQLTQRKAVVGAVRAHATRLKGTLGRNDTQRLDGYVESLHRAEQSLERLTKLSCGELSRPSQASTVAKYEPLWPLISQSNVDTAAASLVCGLSRVVSLNFIPGRGPFQFLDPSPNAYNQQNKLPAHAISSDTRYGDLASGLHLEGPATGNGNSWALDRHNNHHAGYTAMLTAIDRWEAALIARLIERLQNTPEGSGSMWDHTLVLWVNEGGGVHHGGSRDHPAILVGGPAVMGAGGNTPGLLRGGRYLAYPKDTRALSDLFVTVAQTLGIAMPSFGDPAICQGVLPGARA